LRNLYVSTGISIVRRSERFSRQHSIKLRCLQQVQDYYTLLQLDLSSAIDTLDTSTLLRRLRFTYGLSGPALNWVSSYLVCRSQSVRVGQKQSSSIVCEYGVPQESVLGPLLFTLYICPLAKVISSFGVNHAQFADDMQLYIALKDDNSIKAFLNRFCS